MTRILAFPSLLLLACGGMTPGPSVDPVSASPTDPSDPEPTPAALATSAQDAQDAQDAPAEAAPESVSEIELFDDGDARVTLRGDQCVVTWGSAELSEHCLDPQVTRHTLSTNVDALYIQADDGRSLVVNEGGTLRWLSVPWSMRSEYTHSRFPGDGSARFGYEVRTPCRPSARSIARAAGDWPRGANLAVLPWSKGRLREYTFILSPDGLRPAIPSSEWHGPEGACELRASREGRVEIDHRYFQGADDWSRPLDPEAGESEIAASLPPGMHERFHILVSAGAFQPLVIDELIVHGPDSDDDNVCESGCRIPAGSRRVLTIVVPHPTALTLRVRRDQGTTVATRDSTLRLSDEAETLFQDDPNTIRIRHRFYDNSRDALQVGVDVSWDRRHSNLSTPGTREHGPPQSAEARALRIGGRSLLFVEFHWSWEEDEGETESYLLEADGARGLRAVPMAIGVDRHSLNGVEFRPNGQMRAARRATRECSPSAADRRRWEEDYGDEGADAFVQSRDIERRYELIDGVITPSSMPWRWEGPWQRCEGWIMAACPFVDVITESGPVRVGEILRSVQFAPGRQILLLPASHTPVLEVQLSEEKRETTYLDYIAADVGGVLRSPLVCESSDPPAFCVADGQYERIEMGQSLDLQFDVESTQGATLVAEGYYEPY